MFIASLRSPSPSTNVFRVNVDENHLVTQVDYKLSLKAIANYRSLTYEIHQSYKWLFLCSFNSYRSMMDRNYFSQYYVAQRRPNINATLWGYGFECESPDLDIGRGFCFSIVESNRT
jgi:hypothetical protein